ncbi:MAG TPA: glycoside hydrolase family 88 protein [Burkholderiaceae bacterium]
MTSRITILRPWASLVVALLLLGTTSPPAWADAATPAATLALMERVADWQLAHPTVYPADDWTEGVGDAGFMALAGISGNARYRDAMVLMGTRNGWRLGRRPYHADDHVVGQTYAELYQMLRDPKMIGPMRAQFDGILAAPKDGTLDFQTPNATDRWSWCDALFMGPPAWARLARLTGDPRYLEFAIEGWWLTSDYLYDKEEHLYFRDSRYFKQREANGKKVFWGRGNGWVLAGLARMLQYIPEQHPARARFLQQYRDMAQRVLGLQQADGLWRTSLLDPASYPLQETSGTGLYTYALAWGINQGILDRPTFGPAVNRAWRALNASVEADGKLVHVQPIGEAPKHFDAESTDIFAVGAFLMAGSELYRMALEEGGKPAVVTVFNDSALRRPEETIEIADTDGAVMDALTSRLLPTQATAKGLLFQTDLAPGETRRFLLFPRSRIPAQPPVVARAHARFVPERLDDFAWENDRVAHRVYGTALMTDPREKLVSSGVDVWSKRTRKLVQDAWYKSGEYHVDKGEGLDFYDVGRTRGCGGLGIFDGQTLYVSRNFAGYKVLADGPLRAEFELRFEAWDAAGRKIEELRRVSLDAGSNFSRVESRFTASGTQPLTLGVGIVQHGEGKGHYVNDKAGWMSYWEPATGGNGSNACAVIVPGASGYTVNNGNYLALAQAKPRQPFVYYLGAGWSRSGDFADAPAWEAYVSTAAGRVSVPVKVTVAR